MANSTDLMHDKYCVVTGATSGIGLVAAEVLARQGAKLILVARHAERGAAAVSRIQRATGNRAVELLVTNLSVQAQVRQLAHEIRGRFPRLDVLINNAGALFAKRQLSEDGVEMTFALNHVAYFLLTNLLLDSLQAADSARVVNVSSEAHRRAQLDFSDLQGQPRYSGWRAYARSKLANILFTYELARRVAGTSIVTNALHPGVCVGRNRRRPRPVACGRPRAVGDG